MYQLVLVKTSHQIFQPLLLLHWTIIYLDKRLYQNILPTTHHHHWFLLSWNTIQFCLPFPRPQAAILRPFCFLELGLPWRITTTLFSINPSTLPHLPLPLRHPQGALERWARSRITKQISISLSCTLHWTVQVIILEEKELATFRTVLWVGSGKAAMFLRQ